MTGSIYYWCVMCLMFGIYGCAGIFGESSLNSCSIRVSSQDTDVFVVELCDGHRVYYDYRIEDVRKDSNYWTLVADRDSCTEFLLNSFVDSSTAFSGKLFKTKGMVAFEILRAIYGFSVYEITGLKYDVVTKCGHRPFPNYVLMSNPHYYSDAIRGWIDTHYVAIETKRDQYPVITLTIGENPQSIKYTYDPLYDRIVKDSLYYNVVQNKGAWSDLLLSSIADTSQVVVHYINGPLPRSQGVMNYDLVMTVFGVDCFEVFDAKSELSDICECQNKRPLEFLIRFRPGAINGVVEKLQRYIERQ